MLLSHKITLNVPIHSYYKYLYCDVFSTTLPYHKEEVQQLNNENNWFVGKILHWPFKI